MIYYSLARTERQELFSTKDHKTVAGVDAQVALNSVAVISDVCKGKHSSVATLGVADNQIAVSIDTSLDKSLLEVLDGGVGLASIDVHVFSPSLNIIIIAGLGEESRTIFAFGLISLTISINFFAS